MEEEPDDNTSKNDPEKPKPVKTTRKTPTVACREAVEDPELTPKRPTGSETDNDEEEAETPWSKRLRVRKPVKYVMAVAPPEEPTVNYSLWPQEMGRPMKTVPYPKWDLRKVDPETTLGRAIRQRGRLEVDYLKLTPFFTKKPTFANHHSRPDPNPDPIRGPDQHVYPTLFTLRGDNWSTVEKYYFYMLALFSGNEPFAAYLGDLNDPILIKQEPGKWLRFAGKMADFSYRLAVSYELLLEANIAKYTQNPDLLAKLMEKAGTRMVEATDHYQIWACGLKLGDPQLYDLDKWTGYNFFGDLLTLLAEAFLVIKFTSQSPGMPLSPEALRIMRDGPQNPILERLQHPTKKTTAENTCAETERQNLPDKPLGVVFVHHQDDTWESLTKEEAEEHRILITQKDIATLPAKTIRRNGSSMEKIGSADLYHSMNSPLVL